MDKRCLRVRRRGKKKKKKKEEKEKKKKRIGQDRSVVVDTQVE